jgi:hypothetical protein
LLVLAARRDFVSFIKLIFQYVSPVGQAGAKVVDVIDSALLGSHLSTSVNFVIPSFTSFFEPHDHIHL